MAFLKKYISLSLACAALILSGCGAPGPAPSGAGDSRLSITVLDTGDSDCIVLAAPGGEALVIDTGEADDAQHISDFLSSVGVSPDHPATLVLTHPHKDHIGSADALISAGFFSHVYCNYEILQYGWSQAAHNALQPAGLTAVYAGDSIPFAGGALEALSPARDADYAKENDRSLALRYVYMGKTFLFMGDCENKAEDDMIAAYGETLAADWLKAGHHGAADASKKDFLSYVQPKNAVITGDHAADPDHVSDKVLQRLGEYTANIYRTDQHGRIVTYCGADGIEIVTEK